MRRARLLLGTLAVTAAAGCGQDGPAEMPARTTGGGQQGYEARLEPLNESGVEGRAILSQVGRTLRVQITASGLAPRKQHPQHFHRLPSGEPGACPTSTADEDGDGVVSDGESLPVYGPVALELDPFPAADGTGRVSYQGTFDLPPELEPLTDRVIVLHGLELEEAYDPTVPVACGRIG